MLHLLIIKQGALTEHQSLNGYATETWVNNQGYLTQHQSLTNYALKSEIPTVPTNVSAFTNDSGYINDLSSYIYYSQNTNTVYYSQNTNTVYINSATEITDADEVSF